MKKSLLFTLLMLPLAVAAQSDFGLWTSVSAEKKVGKKLGLGLESDFRSRNDFRTADRLGLGIDANYKITKQLKTSVGYTFLYNNRKEKITYHDDGSYNNWRPSYRAPRHRIYADLTGTAAIGRLTLSLRERWQYTYRPTKTTTRYDFDNACWEQTTVNSRSKQLLRSRLKAEYDIPHCKITPYVTGELFNGWALEKTRLTTGADWKINRQNSIGLYYRFQSVTENDGDDDDTTRHFLGLNYKIKF